MLSADRTVSADCRHRVVRTILDDTFSLQAAVLLLTGLLILLAAGLIPRLLDRRQPPFDNKKQPPSRRIESTI